MNCAGEKVSLVKDNSSVSIYKQNRSVLTPPLSVLFKNDAQWQDAESHWHLEYQVGVIDQEVK